MDLSRLFDLITHMRQNQGDPYAMTDKISLKFADQRIVAKKAIQAFMQDVATPVSADKAIQAFSGSGDLPKLTHDVFNVTNTVPNFDTLWQKSFKGISLRKGQLEWEIADVAAGLVFELVPEGSKAKIYGVSGSAATVKVAKYGAGLGITWEMIEGRKLYQFIDLMNQVRSRLGDLWADTHYALLQTAGATNSVDYQGLVTDPVSDRDIATLNVGYITIGTATKDSGYGDTANAVMQLYAPPALKARVNNALRMTQAEANTGRQGGGAGAGAGATVVEFNIQPNFSFNSNLTAAKVLMVLPGNKIQNAAYMQEMSFQETDIETLNELRTYWSAFGAVIGDTDQVAEIDFAD